MLCDIMAFRVVVAGVEDCYRALGIVHGAYPVIPGRFKDYISTPKPNGYRSLHTGVFGPERPAYRGADPHPRHARDCRIRRRRALALQAGRSTQTNGRQYRWLRELLEILEHAGGPEEFLEHTKLEMFQDEVFCFTPEGGSDQPAQRRNAGRLRLRGAFRDRRQVRRRQDQRPADAAAARVLQNGDQVEIITSKAQTPSPTWEHFVVTGKARARIRRFIRSRSASEYLQLGRSILERDVQRRKATSYTDKALEGVPGTSSRRAWRTWRRRSAPATSAPARCSRRSARHQAQAQLRREGGAARSPAAPRRRRRKRRRHSDPRADPRHGLHFAGCCHPLPGDRIVGVVTTGKGITIHTIDCETLEQFADRRSAGSTSLGTTSKAVDAAHVGRMQ